MSQQINLFNPIFLKQKKYFSVVAMLQALALIALGSVGFYWYAANQVEQLARQSAETEKRYAIDQARLARYTAEYSPQKSGLMLSDELKQTEAQAILQQEIIQTLKSGVIGNTSGYAEYMRAFSRQIVNGLWLTQFNIVGDAAQISLGGAVLRPELVPLYVRRLNRENVMRGKSFASLQMQQPKTEAGKEPRYVEFTLQSVETGGAAK